jgi:hypothetical protein
MSSEPLAYAALVSAKGDARPERQSSWSRFGPFRAASEHPKGWNTRRGGTPEGVASRASEAPGSAGDGARNYCRLTFAGFVLLHLGCQAYRARTDSAIPEAGFEATPWLVAALLLGVWLPFAVFAARELGRSRLNLPPLGAERALSMVEPLALLVVLLFALAHGIQFAWPLLTGALNGSDLRSELIAALSGTHSGIPVQAAAYVCAVGASAFYAVRQVQKTWLATRPALARSTVALGVLSYLLGSYAVIRCASGTIFP